MWKDIKDYEGIYQVSDQGDVRSIRRQGWNGQNIHIIAERILKTNKLPKGYLSVCLCKNGISKRFYIHRLVLEAFVGPCPPDMECRHFPDSNPANNYLNNISWGTPEENAKDKEAHGTNGQGIPGKIYGESQHKAVLTDQAVIKIRLLWNTGKFKIASLARQFKVSWSTMKSVVYYETWKHVGSGVEQCRAR